ncbi:MAG: MBL fold metallo-hydrolase [Bacteroidota bacterium]
MVTTIHSLKFGINQCYIIRQKGTIMIDGGPANAIKKFNKYLERLNIQPDEIKLIVLTHGDFDHVGSAKNIKKLTGAKIAIHENDKPNLEQGRFNWPPAVNFYGKFFRGLFYPFLKSISFPPEKADIVLTDSEFPLHNYGIEGTIIYTPGHTMGSVTVLLDSGEAFVGCMAHSGFPFRRKPNLPVFAENIELIKKNWKTIINKGAKTIYPGHGKAFDVEEIKPFITLQQTTTKNRQPT